MARSIYQSIYQSINQYAIDLRNVYLDTVVVTLMLLVGGDPQVKVVGNAFEHMNIHIVPTFQNRL